MTITAATFGRHVQSAMLALALAAPLAAGPALAQQQPINPPAVRGMAQASMADLVERVMPAVVNISASTTVENRGGRVLPQLPPGTPFEDLFEEFFNRRGQQGQAQPTPPQRRSNSAGSGFIIDASGIVITNNHVIGEANDITVILSDGTRLKAEVVGKDAKIDLAVLRVKAEKPLPFVKLGDSEKMRIGDWVIAIGNPFGLGGSVSSGIISARNRNIASGPYDNYIQTDAAINRGNSGGPLFNMEGEVVGINTAILSPTGGSVGIGFAVPTSLAIPVIEQLREFGETRRGWLGVRIQSIDDTTADALGLGKARGALVAGVDENGPGRPAGIEVGDVILRFDGREVADSRDLPRIVAATPVGKEVRVDIIRKGKEMTRTVKLGRLEDTERTQQASIQRGGALQGEPEFKKALGLQLSGLNDELRKRYNIKDTVKGVVVTGVDANSGAADKRIAVGEVIVQVGQETVATPEDVSKRIEALKKQGTKAVLLYVANPQGEERFVAVTMQ